MIAVLVGRETIAQQRSVRTTALVTERARTSPVCVTLATQALTVLLFRALMIAPSMVHATMALATVLLDGGVLIAPSRLARMTALTADIVTTAVVTATLVSQELTAATVCALTTVTTMACAWEIILANVKLDGLDLTVRLRHAQETATTMVTASTAPVIAPPGGQRETVLPAHAPTIAHTTGTVLTVHVCAILPGEARIALSEPARTNAPVLASA